MYALRERRQHVTQEDLYVFMLLILQANCFSSELAVAKVLKKNAESTSTDKLFT